MTASELGHKLESMYTNAYKGEQVTMIYLFGIKYHKEIKQIGVKQVIEASGIHSTYATELAKAVKLAKYVEPIN